MHNGSIGSLLIKIMHTRYHENKISRKITYKGFEKFFSFKRMKILHCIHTKTALLCQPLTREKL